MLGRFIVFVVGLTADIFFRRIRLGQRVPDDGPLLIVANHPNALADPAVLLRVTRRRTRSLAKEPLFRMPVISWLVKGAGAIPVFRSKDGADTSRNDKTFDAVIDALERGEAISLFPEGISHNEPGLQPLKTGVARMALAALAAGGNAARVRVVPVGLTYQDKPAFRSDVIVNVGEPIDADAFVRAHRDAKSGGETPTSERGSDARPTHINVEPEPANDVVRALTNEIFARIQSLTVDLDRWSDAPLVELAAILAVGAPSSEGVLRASSVARDLAKRDPKRLETLRTELHEFHASLTSLQLDAGHLSVAPTASIVVIYVVRHMFALLVGLPVAVVGAIAYAPPFVLLRQLPVVLRTPADTVATVRILGGLFLFPPWHVGLVLALFVTLERNVALLFAIALPFAALYAHAFFRRRKRMWRDGWAFLRLFLSPRTRKSLLAQSASVRAALQDALDFATTTNDLVSQKDARKVDNRAP